MSLTNICRWGILGTASIGRRNWQAIANAGNATLVAVASRNQASAEAYIQQNQQHVPFEPLPIAVEGYAELLKRDDIDAVYIPLPTGIRKEWVIAAAAAGKHVLSEKPCGTNAAQLAEMLAACQEHGVQFMDGVMFMHNQRLQKMKSILTDGKSVGEIRRIASHFCFLGGDGFNSTNIRTNSELEPFGCLGDLGWYDIRLALWALDYQMPVQVVGRMLAYQQNSTHGARVPTEFAAELLFENGVISSFYNSFTATQQQWARITGTAGELQVDDFVQPFKGSQLKFQIVRNVGEQSGCHATILRDSTEYHTEEPSHSAANSQETELFRRFSAIVNCGVLEPHWGEIALKTQQVVDAVFKSANQDGAPIKI